jgi:transposase-like protein
MMTLRNRYCVRSRISEAKFREVLRLSSPGLEATKISKLAGLARKGIDLVPRKPRGRIASERERRARLPGVIEADESFFGQRRVKGRRGRGASGKTTAFGLFKRRGGAYTEIVPDGAKATPRAIVRGRASPEGVIDTDGRRGYGGLVDVGYAKRFRVDHERGEFAGGHAHVNGIEGFRGYAKSRLARFRGIHKPTFYLHLKECERRSNNRHCNRYRLLLKPLRNNPLRYS